MTNEFRKSFSLVPVPRGLFDRKMAYKEPDGVEARKEKEMTDKQKSPAEVIDECLDMLGAAQEIIWRVDKCLNHKHQLDEVQLHRLHKSCSHWVTGANLQLDNMRERLNRLGWELLDEEEDDGSKKQG